MRFIYWYLAAYFVLVIAAAAALWDAGVLGRISPAYLLVAAVVVVGLGVLLAVTSIAPQPVRD